MKGSDLLELVRLQRLQLTSAKDVIVRYLYEHFLILCTEDEREQRYVRRVAEIVATALALHLLFGIHGAHGGNEEEVTDSLLNEAERDFLEQAPWKEGWKW